MTITVRPDDLGKLPKDPTQLPMIFDGVTTPPQSGLLAAPPPSSAGSSPTFTVLPPKEDTAGKGANMDFGLSFFLMKFQF